MTSAALACGVRHVDFLHGYRVHAPPWLIGRRARKDQLSIASAPCSPLRSRAAVRPTDALEPGAPACRAARLLAPGLRAQGPRLARDLLRCWSRDRPPRARVVVAATRSSARGRSPGCATSRDGAPATSCRRSCCRRRRATTPASSTTAPTQSQMRRHPRGRARARASASTGSARRRRPRTRRSTTTSRSSTQSVELLGGRVNLIGDCQGGWLATIYAALHPERVNTLTIAGAPIDFHARRAADPRLRRGAEARHGSTAALVALRRRRAQGRVHARRLHRARAARPRSPSTSSCWRPATTPASSPATAASRTGSSTRRTSRAPSTCGSSSTCSATTSCVARRRCEVGGERGRPRAHRLPRDPARPARKDHITPPDAGLRARRRMSGTPAKRRRRRAERRRSPRPVHGSRGASGALASDAPPRVRASTSAGAARAPLRPVNDARRSRAAPSAGGPDRAGSARMAAITGRLRAVLVVAARPACS